MSNKEVQPELVALRKWIHDLNNRVGVILATAELLELEQLSPRASERRATIEEKSLEVRDILRNISDHYFS
jgi:hypothetical protein